MKYAILIGLCSIGGLFILHQIRLMVREARARKALALPTADVGARPRTDPLTLGIADWGGVFVEADPGDVVLFVLPQTDESLRARIKGTQELGGRIAAVVVIDDPAVGGHLWTTEICEVFGIASDKVHRASAIDDVLQLGALALEGGDANVVLAMHADFADRGLMIGAAITEEQLLDLPTWRVIGSIKGAITAPEALEPILERDGVFLLLADTAPGIDEAAVATLRAAGIKVSISEAAPAWVETATQMVSAITGGDQAKLEDLLAAHDHEVVANSMIGLIAGGDRATAQKLGDAALAKTSHPAVRHQLAVLATLAGEPGKAEDHLRAAIGEPPHPPSLINLAIVLARDPARAAEAIALADRAVELMPDDALAQMAAIMTRTYTGKLDDARAKLAAATVLDARKRIELEATIDAFAKGDAPKLLDTFPQHAELAAQRGRELVDQGAFADAVVVLQRAYELHPLGLEIAADLGHALSQAGRDADAIAHYDAAIAKVPGGDLLRINRGNARRRTGDVAGAIADYDVLVQKAPQLPEVRIGLILALVDGGRAADAQPHLDALAEMGASEAAIADLRDAIAGVGAAPAR